MSPISFFFAVCFAEAEYSYPLRSAHLSHHTEVDDSLLEEYFFYWFALGVGQSPLAVGQSNA